MTVLRLVADDLTGALDSAAQFTGLTGPLPVFWTTVVATPPSSAAFDSATRESDAATAASVAADRATLLATVPGGIAFKKVDSLLRGHAGHELAACLRVLAPAHCVIAPAFPFQGRVTQGGLQYVRDAGGLRRAGEDLAATLRGAGLAVAHAAAPDALPAGISLWDAQTDADLAHIARAGLAAPGRVLWCGSGGLAGALAGVLAGVLAAVPGVSLGTGSNAAPCLAAPILGLFGSDHPVTAAQLRAADAHLVRVADADPAGAARLSDRLHCTGAALAAFDLPQGMARAEAARRIAASLRALIGGIDPPGTLLVAGGETLRALCILLDAACLEVQGQLMPGLPLAVLRGGRWDGVTVIAKSGAFGTAGLLRRLVTGAPLHEELGA